MYLSSFPTVSGYVKLSLSNWRFVKDLYTRILQNRRHMVHGKQYYGFACFITGKNYRKY